jgi:hypothetical protein
MTREDMKYYKENTVKILEEHTQYATAKAVKIAFNALGCVEQFRWERDIAFEMLEDLGLSFAEKTDDKCVITKEEYQELLEYKFMYEALCK